MLGKAHSGQEELEIPRRAARAVATSPVWIFAHSLIAPLGPGHLHHRCCQATKTAPALRGEQTNQVTQRRNVTWLASKMKRGLSGLLRTMAAGISRRVVGSQGIQNLPLFDGYMGGWLSRSEASNVTQPLWGRAPRTSQIWCPGWSPITCTSFAIISAKLMYGALSMLQALCMVTRALQKACRHHSSPTYQTIIYCTSRIKAA